MNNDIDYSLYDKIFSNIRSYLTHLYSYNHRIFIYTYLNALFDFKIIDFDLFDFCLEHIEEDLKKYEK